MGRFAASVLFLLGACGDNVDVGGLGAGPNDDIQPGGNGDVIPRYVPQVCGVSQWTPTIGIDPATDVSVTPRPTGGATVLGAPRAGGALTGFQLDPRMGMEGGDATKVPIETSFSAVTVSYISDRVVSTGISDGAVYVHMLDDQLQSPQYIAKLPGTAIADPAYFYAQGNLVMPVATTTGLTMYRFDDSLEPLDSKQFLATKPALSVTSAQLGTAMMTAWSTDSECYLMVNTTYEPGVSARVPVACPNPRLSVNQTNGDAVMLFDSPDGIRLMPIHITMFGGDAPVIRADANSPRTVFDGTNFWVSYLDARGDVVVGFLDKDLKPVTMSLGAPQPQRTAYELVMIDGSPTIFSLDANGYTAYRMCVEAQF